MTKVIDVLEILDQIAPVKYALGFDNVGLLVGDGNRVVNKILVALDITESVIKEAKKTGANLIVAHHPVIFEPLKSVVAGDVTANHVIELIENKISAICMHTNLDAAVDGVNDTLAEIVGISCDGYLEPVEDVGIGRHGSLSETMEFDGFLSHVAKKLEIDGLRYLKVKNTVEKVAVGGGSCGGMLSDAVKAGCDTLITADIKHSVWLEARELGINLIDAGHFSTENVICEKICDKLSKNYPNIDVKIAKANSVPMLHFKMEEAD